MCKNRCIPGIWVFRPIVGPDYCPPENSTLTINSTHWYILLIQPLPQTSLSINSSDYPTCRTPKIAAPLLVRNTYYCCCCAIRNRSSVATLRYSIRSTKNKWGKHWVRLTHTVRSAVSSTSIRPVQYTTPGGMARKRS